MLKPFFWGSNAVNSMKWWCFVCNKMHLWGHSNDSEAIMMTLKSRMYNNQTKQTNKLWWLWSHIFITNRIWRRVNECRTPTELIRTLEKGWFRVDLLITIIFDNTKIILWGILLSSKSWALNIRIELPWCSPINGDSISAPNNLQQDSCVYSTIYKCLIAFERPFYNIFDCF